MKNLFKVVSCVVLLSFFGYESCFSWPFSKKTDLPKKEAGKKNDQKTTKKADLKNIKKEQKSLGGNAVSGNDSPEIIKLLQDSELAISRLESNLAKKEQQLKAATDEKLAKIAQELKTNLSSESFKIRQEATSQTLGIINKAEGDALALKQHDRLRTFSERFGIPLDSKNVVKIASIGISKPGLEQKAPIMTPDIQTISAEMRNTLSRQFYEDMLFMKNIIIGGELPNEIKDFEKRFTMQNKWFDKTLKKAVSVNDGYYLQLQEKQKKVHDVVIAQRQADKMLFKMANGLAFSSGQLNKARLMALYDLNDSLRNKEEDADDDEEVSLSRNDIEVVIKKVFADISTKYKEREGDFPDVKILNNKTAPYIPIMAQRLQARLISVQGKLAKAEQLLATRKDFADTLIVQRLEQTNKHAMGLEIDLRKSNETSALLQRDALGATTLLFAKKLEGKERSNLELDVLLRRVSQQADYFKQRVGELVGRTSLLEEQINLANNKTLEAERSGQQQFVLRKEAENKRSLDQQIAQETIASINKYLQNERTELQEVKNKLRLTEDILKKSQHDATGQSYKIQEEHNVLLARQASLIQEKNQLEQLRTETKRLVENSMRANDNAIIDSKKSHASEMHKMQAELKQELDFVRQELSRIQGIKQQAGATVPVVLPQKMVPVQQVVATNSGSHQLPTPVALAMQSADEEDDQDEED